MRQAKHFGVVGAALGFGVALVLAELAYLVNSHGITYHLEDFRCTNVKRQRREIIEPTLRRAPAMPLGWVAENES